MLSDTTDRLTQQEAYTLLQKLLQEKEARTEKMKGYQSKYIKKRRENDMEFREAQNQCSSAYCRKRYSEDAEYREHMRARARNYYAKKVAARKTCV